MATFLFCWELGENFGHLSRDLPPALKLRDLGHTVIFAVRDTSAARQVLTPHKFRYIAAPLAPARLSGLPPAASYAEILQSNGYGSHEILSSLVEAWLQIFKDTKAAVVISNHAPTALLASRCAALPSVATCIGFEVPPRHDRSRPFIANTSVSKERLQISREVVLQSINRVLKQRHKPEIFDVSEIFAESKVLMTTFPELDHYGPRNEYQYIGPISGLEAPVYDWKKLNTKHIFCYLRNNVPSMQLVLEALRESKTQSLCVVPDFEKTELDRYTSQNMEVRSEPVDITSAIQQADLVITYGTGTMHDALLHGKPMLICPKNTEQFLAGKKVVALGAGLILPIGATPTVIGQVISLLISDTRYFEAAQRFSSKNCEFSASHTVESIVYSVLSMA